MVTFYQKPNETALSIGKHAPIPIQTAKIKPIMNVKLAKIIKIVEFFIMCYPSETEHSFLYSFKLIYKYGSMSTFIVHHRVLFVVMKEFLKSES